MLPLSTVMTDDPASAPRIAILGAHGQLGVELQRALGERTCQAWGRAELDLTNPDQVAQQLIELGPHVVINCAADNRVDAAEANPEAAFVVNAFGVLHLARACRTIDAHLIQISTDYVFAGTRTTPYQESDTPQPVSVYGISKLAGELFAQAFCARTLIVRTSGLYGPAGRKQKGGRGHFVETILARARNGQELRVVSDQMTAPTACREVAEAIVRLLDARATGIVHVTNAGACSWFEFAQAVLELSHVRATVTAISTDSLQLPAQRPRYSVLDNARMRALQLPPLRDWRAALAEYLADYGAAD